MYIKVYIFIYKNIQVHFIYKAIKSQLTHNALLSSRSNRM